VPSVPQIKKDVRALYAALLRQIHETNQSPSSTKRDKVKKILALINEVQDSINSDEELDVLMPTKTAMVCNLSQVPPEIWMTLSLEAEKWLLNEIIHQEQEDEKVKKLLSQSKNKVLATDKDNNNPSMPNQHARVKNAAKGEEVAQDIVTQTYGYVDEFLEEAIKSSSLYESDQDSEYEYWTTDCYSHATFSIRNTSHNTCMKLPILQDRYHIRILDGEADACVSGKGWKVIAFQLSRRANVVCRNHRQPIGHNDSEPTYGQGQSMFPKYKP
jgi:hypothetical protein